VHHPRRFPLLLHSSIVEVSLALSPESIVPNAFSLSKSAGSRLADPSLRTEISRHTLSEVETSGILRSLERFGDDPSIERYEITPMERGRSQVRTKTVAWTVRAVRSSDPRRE